MTVYLWKARRRQGTMKRGELEAANDAAVISQLRAQMLHPVTVKKKPKDVREFLPSLKPRIKTKDLVIFTRQFATMIDAGLPLVQCLQILGEQQENPTFREIINQVRSDVEQGSTFADALAKHPKAFDALYVNLVAAGEIGGILDTILNRLAVYLEKADALARKVRGAMVYPGTVLTVAVGVMVLMLVKIIPTFEAMFHDFGGELPGPTQAVINMSHWMQEWLAWFLLGFSTLCFARIIPPERNAIVSRLSYPSSAFLSTEAMNCFARRISLYWIQGDHDEKTPRIFIPGRRGPGRRSGIGGAGLWVIDQLGSVDAHHHLATEGSARTLV